MSDSIEHIKSLLEGCSKADREMLKSYLDDQVRHPLEIEWGVDASTILTAIRRSSDLTRRGVRGIIAEAVFDDKVVPGLKLLGWSVAIIEGDKPYDVLLRHGDRVVTIQIKLQRMERGIPKLYYPKHYTDDPLFVVEVQKTRSGEATKVEPAFGLPSGRATQTRTTVQTRPYRFGDFDILAVSMHPSSGRWTDFRYTLGRWLLPRRNDLSLIEIFQPVSGSPNDLWTDDLATCVNWLSSGESKQILKDPKHFSKTKLAGKAAKRSKPKARQSKKNKSA